MSRVRALLDEAEEIPSGVWEGVANLLASGWGPETVKVCCATNPRDVTSKLAQLAEPVTGWTTLNMDTDTEWVSAERWQVLRLDGATTENVAERKLVFPGFLTFDGFQKYALELGGQSPKYLTFGRAMYPLAALQNTIIPYSLLEAVIGRPAHHRDRRNRPRCRGRRQDHCLCRRVRSGHRIHSLTRHAQPLEEATVLHSGEPMV